MNKPQKRVLAVFAEAIEIEDADEREAFLASACAGNGPLRQEVEELLRAEALAGDFLPDQPLNDLAAQLVVQEERGQVTNDTEQFFGDRVERYRLLQKIGEGGCGIVYLAEQRQPVRRGVAVKVIKLGMDTRNVVARFEAERQALAMMDHPNIAKVLDAGTTERGRPYFVMELVRGVKITQFCDDQRYTVRQRLDLFIQVCHAVQHAHQKGIIHRDIKPSNILVVDHDGRPLPKIIDFGIAKATTDQRLTEKTVFTTMEQVIGTPAYMSPEQAGLSALDIDTRSDIYSLGVLLYELLTGRTPFEAQRLREQGLDEFRRIIREEEPLRPSTKLQTLSSAQQKSIARLHLTDPQKLVHFIRGDLDWVVLKALEKDRNRRYETVNGLARDIERHLRNEPVVARAPSVSYRFQKVVVRHKGAFVAAGAVLAVLVLGLAFSVWQAMRATQAESAQISLLKESQLSERKALQARAEEMKQRQAAEQARKQAEQNGRRLANVLNQVESQRVEDLFSADDSSKALAYLALLLRRDPANEVAAARLLSALTLRSFPIKLTPPLLHEGSVYSVQFSPDGQRVVTVSDDDNTARLWDAQTGLPVTAPLRHHGWVWYAEFSPDGKRVVTASADHTARIWDAETGRPVGDPLEHGDQVWSARYSPDGRFLVTASNDRTAQIWDAQTGQPLTRPLQHGNHVSYAEFSPDGRYVATASDDKTAQIWEVLTGKPSVPALKHKGRVWFAQFSPDGSRLVTASDDHTARIWEVRTGEPLTGPLRHTAGVLSAEFSLDGQRLVTASEDKTSEVWDAQTGQPITPPLRHEGRVMWAKFSPDGQKIITASDDRTARIWDAQTGQPLSEPLRHQGSVRFAQFSPDGLKLATASEDGTAQIWNAQTSRLLTEPLTHADHITSAVFDPTGERISTSSDDNTARVWDMRTGQPLTPPLVHEDHVTSVRFDPDGRRVLTSSLDGTARVWDARSGAQMTPPLLHAGEVYSAEFSPDGLRIVTAAGSRKAGIWEAATGKLLKWLPHDNRVLFAEFSPDGQRVVTAAADNTARVWDAQTGQPLTEGLQHGNNVVSAHFSPDGRRVVTGSYDKTARIWDAQTGKPLTLPLKHEDSVTDAHFSPDGRRVITASWDRTARIWDVQTGQPFSEPLEHKDRVRTARFSPDGTRVITASADASARVWDAQTGQPLTEALSHGDHVNFATFSPDGQRAVTASDDNSARVWEVSSGLSPVPEWMIELAEVLAAERVNDRHVLEPVQFTRLSKLQRDASMGPVEDVWKRWARWFFATSSDRTISPCSERTVSQYVQNRINQNTIASLQEAVTLTPTNGLALARLAGLLLALEPKENRNRVPEAQWYSSRALHFAPGEAEVWEVRTRALERAGELSAALDAIQGALKLQPENPDFWEKQGHLFAQTLRPDAAYESFTKAILLSGKGAPSESNSPAKFFLTRSHFLKSQNRSREAAEDFGRAMSIPPRGPSASAQSLTGYSHQEH